MTGRHAHPKRRDDLRLVAGLLWVLLLILIVVLLDPAADSPFRRRALPPHRPAAVSLDPTTSSAVRVAARSTTAERVAGPDQFPIAGSIDIPTPG